MRLTPSGAIAWGLHRDGYLTGGLVWRIICFAEEAACGLFFL